MEGDQRNLFYRKGYFLIYTLKKKNNKSIYSYYLKDLYKLKKDFSARYTPFDLAKNVLIIFTWALNRKLISGLELPKSIRFSLKSYCVLFCFVFWWGHFI